MAEWVFFIKPWQPEAHDQARHGQVARHYVEVFQRLHPTADGVLDRVEPLHDDSARVIYSVPVRP